MFIQSLILGILFYGSCHWVHVCGVTIPTNITVARDSSGDFQFIGEALLATPNNSDKRIYINIKAGVYKEIIDIGQEKTMISFVGEGLEKTIIVGSRSNLTGFKTYKTATVRIAGNLFVAIGITFQNDAGPEGMQAVAVRNDAQSAFYKCRFLGYQDTLYARAGRQFYKECEVYGTVDFIWGNAEAVFQNCRIFVRRPLERQYLTITAQGRTRPTQETGTVLDNYIINATDGLRQKMFQTYFGRPWKTYARVVIINSYIGEIVDPLGWKQWDGSTQTNNVYYAEYNNSGPGCNTNGRAHWSGVKKSITYEEASKFSVKNFISGDKWIPATGIPFDSEIL